MKAMVLDHTNDVSTSPLRLQDRPIPVPTRRQGPRQDSRLWRLSHGSPCGGRRTSRYSTAVDPRPSSRGYSDASRLQGLRGEGRGPRRDCLASGHMRIVRILYKRAGKPLFTSDVHRLSGQRRVCRICRRPGTICLSNPFNLFDERSRSPVMCGNNRLSSVTAQRNQAGPTSRAVWIRRIGPIAIQIARHWGCQVYVSSLKPEHQIGKTTRCNWVGGQWICRRINCMGRLSLHRPVSSCLQH